VHKLSHNIFDVGIKKWGERMLLKIGVEQAEMGEGTPKCCSIAQHAMLTPFPTSTSYYNILSIHSSRSNGKKILINVMNLCPNNC